MRITLLLIVIFLLSSCASPEKSKPAASPTTVGEAIVGTVEKTVYKLDTIKTIAIVGIGFSVFAILAGAYLKVPMAAGLGFAGLVSCLVVLLITFTSTFYPIPMAIGGMLLGGTAIGYAVIVGAGYLKKELRRRNKALTETIVTVEEIKRKIPLKDKADLFGTDDKKGFIETVIQSPETTELVKSTKDILKTKRELIRC